MSSLTWLLGAGQQRIGGTGQEGRPETFLSLPVSESLLLLATLHSAFQGCHLVLVEMGGWEVPLHAVTSVLAYWAYLPDPQSTCDKAGAFHTDEQ